MKRLPILNIQEFNKHYKDDTFYTNYFIPHLAEHHHSILGPHRHDFYLTVFFTKGTGTHEIDFSSYPIKPGCIFLLNPGQTHNWKLSEDIDGYVIFHSKSFYDMAFNGRTVNNFPFFYSTQNSPCIYLDKNNVARIESLFKSLVEEYQSFLLLKRQKIISLVDILYIELSRFCIDESVLTSKKTNNYSIKFRALEQLMEQKYQTEKSPKYYASELHISPKHLNRIVKEMVGKTTSDLIIERIILEAKRMLIHAKHNFSEIAHLLGYEDYAYFSRIFKNKTGENPSLFRERHVK